MLVDKNESHILNEESINNQFSSATLKDIKENCKIFNGDFFLDSFNYFPVSKNFETFHHLFKRDDQNLIDHFYTEDFFNNFNNKKNDFKIIKNSIVLGSSPADNYFTNLIHFFPRIFFVNEKKINLVIHRNLSNKFRNFIKLISEMREIQFKFNFVDDDFYKFENSSIHQFFNIKTSIKILKYFLNLVLPNIDAPEFRPKIYIRRENAHYRKIINEADLIDRLRKKGFEIINPQHFEILTQMKIFSNAELIISPHGSNLANIICCTAGTKIIEISPYFDSNENYLLNRYKNLSDYLNLKYHKINADSVNVENHSQLSKKYIKPEFLNNSNYYKNLILKVSEIDKLINIQ